MSNRIKKRFALICVVLLLTALLCTVASGFQAESGTPADTRIATIIPIYVDGMLVCEGEMFDGVSYVGMRAFCEAVSREITISWDQEKLRATAAAEGLELKATVGDEYISANDRYFYLPDGVQVENGAVILPIREIAKVFKIEVIWNEDFSISLDMSGFGPLEHADAYYDEDDLYWLSRAIYSESGNQPFEGKVGVGNVILNRIDDPACPDTVYDVIFDTKYGTQFSVTESGTIYLDPCDDSVIAAKVCMEGYETVGDSMFFVNPQIGVSSWFTQTRTYVVTHGDHDFYA